MRKLGMRAYLMNHTEDGFPPGVHALPLPVVRGAGLRHLAERARAADQLHDVHAAAVGQPRRRPVQALRHPFDTGWANRIHWDHEFAGRAALLEISKKPPRTVVTLEWNADDIAEIHASQLRGLTEEPYMPIDLTGPSDNMEDVGVPDPATGLPKTKDYHADLVLTPEGEEIGFSAGRVLSTSYRRMISLGFIDQEYALSAPKSQWSGAAREPVRSRSGPRSPGSPTSWTSATTRSTSTRSHALRVDPPRSRSPKPVGAVTAVHRSSRRR
ncbi:hypothetical protein ACRAWF_30340 [Streptomyces sp. L7]